ncbi:kelch-like protein 10 [Anguilla anguilla]|uniref:kelch-like protein 10 n=1 Tax=Anguilla anguilla TaxID=7936 RepID=UPI0015A9C055|nr:kelch-like protein 10 [Anguilla anguilla]
MEYGVDDESHVDYAILNKLRLDGRFCDVVIRVEGFTMKAHKIVLCACSSYFRALFTGNFNNSQKRVYSIPGVLPEMMKIIVEYAYTHSVVVTKDNVERLLPAADQLCVLGVVQACADFLEAQLCTHNCIGIWRFTNIYFCPELRRTAYRFILQNFEEVGQTSPEFLELTLPELCDIVEKDDLTVKQEDRVFDAVLRWTAHLPTKRKSHLPRLLPKVRMALMNADYFMNNMKTNALVKDNEECKPIIINTLRAMCSLRKTNFVGTSCYSNLCRPRLPYAVLLAIGGWSGNRPTSVVESYDTQANCWVTVAQTESPRAYHGTVYLDGFVYCVGGYDAVEFFSAVCKFDPVARGWHKVAPMHSRRCYVSVTVLRGCIYAMGGFDGYTRLSSAERYEPATNQWSLIPPMNEQRSDASAATLDGKVYICGGFNGENCLCTAEYYSPHTNQWTLITPMKSRHSGLGVVAYKEEIYVVGGFDGVSRLRSVEAYDPLADSWRQMPDMIIARSNFGIEVMDDRLFVVGGFNGFSTTFYAEYFDQKTNEWGSIQDMGVFRSALSCCTVADLANVAEYAAPRSPGSPTAELSTIKELTL